MKRAEGTSSPPSGATSRCGRSGGSWRERAGRPTIGARFGVILPQTSFEDVEFNPLGLGPNTLRAFVEGLLTQPVGRGRLHVNAGLFLQDEVYRLHDQRDFLSYGLAFEWPATPRLALLAEVAGRAGDGRPGAEERSEARAGVRFGRGRVRWDVAVRRGLAEADGTWGATLGLTWTARGPRVDPRARRSTISASSASSSSMGLPFMLLAARAFATSAGTSDALAPQCERPGTCERPHQRLDPRDAVLRLGVRPAGDDRRDLAVAAERGALRPAARQGREVHAQDGRQEGRARGAVRCVEQAADRGREAVHRARGRRWRGRARRRGWRERGPRAPPPSGRPRRPGAASARTARGPRGTGRPPGGSRGRRRRARRAARGRRGRSRRRRAAGGRRAGRGRRWRRGAASAGCAGWPSPGARARTSTALRVTSEPVPAVVGMATKGAEGRAIGCPRPTTSR